MRCACLHLFYYVLFVCSPSTRFAVASGQDAVDSLFKKIFVGNNAKLRPLRNQTDVLYLHVFFHLTSIVDVSEVDQRVEINAWVNLSWIDELRVWDPLDYEGLDMFFPEPGDAWSPRLLVSNTVDKPDVFEDDHTYHFLFANGSTRFYPAGVFRLSCDMKMSYFPFDTQVCHLRVLTKYLAGYVKFVVMEKENESDVISGFRPHGEWDLSHVTQTAFDEAFEEEIYSIYYMTFHLTRKPTFVVLVVVLPVILLSMISLLVFLLPTESGEKVSFGITVLLSLSVFTSFVSDLLPRNSQSLPILVIYLFALMVLTGLAVVTTIVMMASSPDETDAAEEDANNVNASGTYNTINNNNNSLAMEMESEHLAKEIRLLRSASFNAYREGRGAETGHLSAPRSNLSSSFKRCHHAKHGGTTANHVNQWRTAHEQPTCLQNGIYSDPMEIHANSTSGQPNGVLTQGLSAFDSCSIELGDSTIRRRPSISIFDKIARRNSLKRSGLGHHRRGASRGGHRPSSRKGGCRSQFLCRIPTKDKFLFGLFFFIWLLLTGGFVLYTALQ